MYHGAVPQYYQADTCPHTAARHRLPSIINRLANGIELAAACMKAFWISDQHNRHEQGQHRDRHPDAQICSEDPHTFQRAASSTIIRFATEPSSVRLPAKVEAAASINQPRCESGKALMKCWSSSTAGTLLIRVRETNGDQG